MDNKDQNLNNQFDIEIDNENLEDKEVSIQKQIYEIEIKLQEIDSQIEFYEDKLYELEDNEEYIEMIENLKIEYKNLKKQKKEISKQIKTNWDKIPIWMFAYGVFQIILSFFYVMNMLQFIFSQWFVNLIYENIEVTKFWQYFSVLLIPIINLLITLIILILIKDKVRKKFMIALFSIQTIETIISVINVIIIMRAL